MRSRCTPEGSREFEVHHSRERGNLEICETAEIMSVEQIVETLSQGCASGSCRSLALGYFLMPFQGA